MIPLPRVDAPPPVPARAHARSCKLAKATDARGSSRKRKLRMSTECYGRSRKPRKLRTLTEATDVHDSYGRYERSWKPWTFNFQQHINTSRGGAVPTENSLMHREMPSFGHKSCTLA